MKKTAICFTLRGMEIIKRLNSLCSEKGLGGIEAYSHMESAKEQDGFCPVTESVENWTRSHFLPGCALIYVGAVGIAVRAIAGVVKDKLTDCPVLVIDDNARYVIPILSGHVGGANKLAAILAQLLGAQAVITTSTDGSGAFSADLFAVENRLSIANREGIRHVSARAVEGKAVTISIKDYPPKFPVDIIVADETDAEYSLLLRPKRYTVGLGMKKGKDKEELERFFLEILRREGLSADDVYALCTIDRKEEEPALTALRDKYRIPVISFDADLLGKAAGEFTPSQFVRETVGIDNVCERAAVLGAGPGGELCVRKQAMNGMTMAVARRCVRYNG